MADPFRPLDLSDSYNAGTDNLEGDGRWLWPAQGDDRHSTPLKQMPDGDCLFFGVPFQLAAGEAPKRFVVVVDDEAVADVPASVTVPVGETTRRLLFVHACAPISGEWSTVEGAGEQIGGYRITYDDGSILEQSLRRRFEIHDTNIPWGHHPFVCRNCREFRTVGIHDRTVAYGPAQVGLYSSWRRPGSDESAGTGSDMQGWWLFDWENPHPDKRIESVEIAAAGPTAVALAAITLCDEETDPLAWPARKEIAVTVDGDDEANPGVTIDRGVIARKDRLLAPGDDFLTTDETGWGTGGQVARPGGYVEVHGSAKAQLEVTAPGEEAGATFRWGDVIEKGTVRDGKIQVEMVNPRGKQWVHVRVVDQDTGKPVGTRVHFRSSQGAYLAPHGHQADVNDAWFEDMGGDCKIHGTPYAYIDGGCQIELPVGSVFVEAVRGFEYAPVREKIEVKPGQRHLTLKLKRAFDMKERGYYSGDTHVHFLSSQSAHLEAAGEDLNVVNLLASQWGRLFTSWKEFTGGLAPTSSEDHKIWVSQENRQHILGHISLLGLKEMVAPICTGGPNEDWLGGEIQTLMADWAEACKSQGGLVIMPHMPVPDFENAANIVMGHADAAEMCWVWLGEQIGQGEKGYYRWLNVGQKLPIVGGTDKMSNNRVLGGSRTYAKLADGEEFTFDNWCQAVRRGTTFASTGAMIDLRVEGREMGQQIDLPGNGGSVEVEVTAESIWPLTAVQVIVNGVPVARQDAGKEGARKITLKHKLEAGRSCWVAARCWGPYMTDAGPVMAHSSPVYIDVGKRCAFEPTDGEYLLTHMEGGKTWADKIGVFKDEAVRERLIALFGEAQGELKKRGG